MGCVEYITIIGQNIMKKIWYRRLYKCLVTLISNTYWFKKGQ